MKNKHSVILKYLFSFIMLVVLIYGIAKISPIVIGGYNMYHAAVEKESIEDTVEKIKQDENYITIDEMPNDFKAELLKSEDRRFYSHIGIDPKAIVRATIHNIQKGRFAEGGSTITQQLAKNLYFSFEKKLERKVAELFVVFQLENMLDKDEILELYCNVIYFGESTYGLEEASQHYFNKTPDNLSESQIKSLVYTIKSPNNYNPNVYHKSAA